jgi:mannose-6-phosphate isomerase-like protein (cupin superfamily)
MSTTLHAATHTRPHLGTHELSLVVRRIAADPRRWRPAVRFGTAERYWTRLDGPDGVDVWLLTWLPSQGTDLHDHGTSAAAFAVVDGTLTEVRADPAIGTWSTAVSAPAVRVVEPGVVHDVRNDHRAPAVSIHAYSPRLSRMTYYDLQDGLLVARREVLSDEPEVAS